MNERIKELVEQTARELVYEHDDDIGGVMDVWKFQNKDIEKFAELIVRECADISYKIAWDDLVRGESESVIPLHIYNSLNEHFGVE